MKQMAIIKDVGFGVRDTNHAMLYFTVWMSESSASLICLNSKYTINLIETHQITNIENLEGKPCWVDVDGNSVKFIDLASIK